MSIKIGKWLSGIWTGISKIWKRADITIKILTPVAIAIVQNVKRFVDSPMSDVVTALIPSNIDDKVKDKLKQILPDVIIKLDIINSIAGIENRDEKVKAILKALKFSPQDSQNVFYHGLAALILEKLSDGKLTWSEAAVIAEYYYKNEHTK